MEFSNWNAEVDVLAESLCVPTHWAYSLNTLVGQYSMDIHKETVCESIDMGLTFSYTSETINLILKNDNKSKCIMKNVTVWPHNFHDKFMVFHSNDTGSVYLIDSRGIIFLTDTKMQTGALWNYGTVKLDRKKSCYIINNSVCVYYRTAEERAEFLRKSQGNGDVHFNKDFNRFIRNDAHNTTTYLYLTAGQGKCGAMVDYFGNRGMKYERVPNFLCDDDTVNIRIPLDEKNVARTDVQFLCAKYYNTYSIYGIPLTKIGSALVLPNKHKQLFFSWGFVTLKGNETMIYSIVDTLRSASGAKDDYDLYKKSFAKIKKLFDRGKRKDIKNSFLDIKLMHPNEIITKTYLQENLTYINNLLELSGNSHRMEIETTDFTNDAETAHLFSGICNYDFNLYRIAYEHSKKMFIEALRNYESSVLAEMNQQGIKISRWKNESDLFGIVHKEYPDAIYQYHTDWLGLQSLDVYIPSIKLGIEYQGEQHYKPIEFFGGENAYKETVKRDKRKADLCAAHDITLLYWKYDEVINKTELKKKIKNALGND